MDSQSASIQSDEVVKDDSLKGKTVFVTGGGSGLGAALCKVFASSGANVIAGDLKKDKADATCGALSCNGSRSHAIQLDVADASAVERAISEIANEFGSLDVLVNNAGTDVTLPIDELADEEWQRVIDTNLNGPFLLTKYALPYLKQSGSAHVINIASTAARRAWPNAAAYHASKWGLLGLSHAMHAELRPQDIKVTAVLVGGMRTPFLLDRFPDIDASKLQDPLSAAKAIKSVLLLPKETVIPEMMVIPMTETSWP